MKRTFTDVKNVNFNDSSHVTALEKSYVELIIHKNNSQLKLNVKYV